MLKMLPDSPLHRLFNELPNQESHQDSRQPRHEEPQRHPNREATCVVNIGATKSPTRAAALTTRPTLRPRLLGEDDSSLIALITAQHGPSATPISPRIKRSCSKLCAIPDSHERAEKIITLGIKITRRPKRSDIAPKNKPDRPTYRNHRSQKTDLRIRQMKFRRKIRREIKLGHAIQKNRSPGEKQYRDQLCFRSAWKIPSCPSIVPAGMRAINRQCEGFASPEAAPLYDGREFGSIGARDL